MVVGSDVVVASSVGVVFVAALILSVELCEAFVITTSPANAAASGTPSSAERRTPPINVAAL